MKFLLFLVLVYIGYRALKNWTLKNIHSGRTGSGEEIEDLMVQDPYCNTYFPRRDAKHVRIDGEDFYFCSAECRDRFLSERSP